MTIPLKLSQAIRVFATPLIDALPNPDDVPALRVALLLASTVWNAQIERALGKESDFEPIIAKGIQELSLAAHMDRAVIEAAVAKLPRRKKTLFKSDLRLIAEVKVLDEGNEYRVVAAGLDVSKLPGGGR